MKAMLSIGSEFAPGIFSDIADALCKILVTAKETGMDQSTTTVALEVLPKITKIEHVTVEGSTFTSNPSVKGKRTGRS
jgi:hypothetical protein